MKLCIEKTKQILDFVPTISGVKKVCDESQVHYAYGTQDFHLSRDLFLQCYKSIDQRCICNKIEICVRCGNTTAPYAIHQYMTETLGISKNDFEMYATPIGKNVLKIVIH
jgi:hypothetical protein